MKATPENAAASWFEGPLGARVLREEAALARLALDDVFGFELLQVGAWGPARHLLDGARTQHTSCSPPTAAPASRSARHLTSLPFASDSIDAILLPHTLELVEDPYAVLREAERVLCAEGCLMICGFNPWSGWGARRLFARLFRPPGVPAGDAARARRAPAARLDGAARLRGGGRLWIPRQHADGRPPAPRGLQRISARSALTAGGYLLKARKRVQTLTLVRPRRRASKRVLVPASEPTSKVGP